MPLLDKSELRALIDSTGYTGRECAALLGVNSRNFRLMLDDNKTRSVMPYPVQCGLQALAGKYRAGDVFLCEDDRTNADTKGRRYSRPPEVKRHKVVPLFPHISDKH